MTHNARAALASLALCITFVLLFPTVATAQAISQTDQSGARAGIFLGQSFTANFTGTVAQIAVVPSSGGATTLYVYNGAGTGAANAAGTPVLSQPVTLAATGGFQTLTLSTPVAVMNGQTYSFAFASADLTISAFGNAYPGGGYFTGGTSFAEPNADLTFQIFSTPPAPVPTLPQWAMILMGLMLAGGAAVMIQQRRSAI